jgi:hypothetical protein
MTCMHPYLIWNIGPPSLMFHRHRVPLFAFRSLLCSFDALVHSCASHHSIVNAVPILGYRRWLLLSLFIKLDYAPKCGVAWFIMKDFISWFLPRIVFDWLCASCQHPSRWSINHELVSNWNILFKYMLSSTFLETIKSSRHASHSLP